MRLFYLCLFFLCGILTIANAQNEVSVTVAMNAFKQGDYKHAMEIADQVIKFQTISNSQKRNIYYIRGYGLYKENNYEEAIKDFDIALDLKLYDKGTQLLKAECYYYLNKFDRAIQEFNLTERLWKKTDDNYNNMVAYIQAMHAKCLYKLGKYNESIEKVNGALLLDSTLMDAWETLGDIYYTLKQYDTSRHYYAQAIFLYKQNQDNSTYAWLWRGKVFEEQNKVDSAIADFRRVIDLRPIIREPYIRLGACYELKSKVDSCLKYYLAALDRTDSTDLENIKALTRQIGVMYKKVNQCGNAIEYFKKALAIDITYKEVYRDMADCYVATKQLDKAIDPYEKAIFLYKGDKKDSLELSSLYLKLGDVYKKTNNLAKAKENFTGALKYNKGNNTAGMQQANVLFANKKYKESIPFFKIVLENKTGTDSTVYNEAYFKRGMSYLYLKDTNNAIADLEAAMGYPSTDSEAYVKLADLYFVKKNYSKENALLTNLEATASGLPAAKQTELYYMRGLSNFKEKNIEAAKKDLLKSISLNDNNPKAYRILAQLEDESGDLKGAEKSYTRCIDLHRSEKDSLLKLYINRAIVRSKLKQYQEALDDCEQANRLKSNQPRTLITMAGINSASGNTTKAMALYNQVLKLIKPTDKEDNARVNYGMALCYKEMGQTDKAIPLLNNALTQKPDYAEAQKLLEDVKNNPNINSLVSTNATLIDTTAKDITNPTIESKNGKSAKGESIKKEVASKSKNKKEAKKTKAETIPEAPVVVAAVAPSIPTTTVKAPTKGEKRTSKKKGAANIGNTENPSATLTSTNNNLASADSKDSLAIAIGKNAETNTIAGIDSSKNKSLIDANSPVIKTTIADTAQKMANASKPIVDSAKAGMLTVETPPVVKMPIVDTTQKVSTASKIVVDTAKASTPVIVAPPIVNTSIADTIQKVATVAKTVVDTAKADVPFAVTPPIVKTSVVDTVQKVATVSKIVVDTAKANMPIAITPPILKSPTVDTVQNVATVAKTVVDTAKASTPVVVAPPIVNTPNVDTVQKVQTLAKTVVDTAKADVPFVVTPPIVKSPTVDTVQNVGTGAKTVVDTSKTNAPIVVTPPIVKTSIADTTQKVAIVAKTLVDTAKTNTPIVVTTPIVRTSIADTTQKVAIVAKTVFDTAKANAPMVVTPPIVKTSIADTTQKVTIVAKTLVDTAKANAPIVVTPPIVKTPTVDTVQKEATVAKTAVDTAKANAPIVVNPPIVQTPTVDTVQKVATVAKTLVDTAKANAPIVETPPILKTPVVDTVQKVATTKSTIDTTKAVAPLVATQIAAKTPVIDTVQKVATNTTPIVDTTKAITTTSETKPEIKSPSISTNNSNKPVDTLAANELFKNKKYEEAIPAFSSIITNTPSDQSNTLKDAYSKRASAYQETKAYSKAIADYEKLIALHPDNETNVQAHYYMAICYKELGDKDKAIASINQALALKPEFEDAKMLLKLLQQ